MMLGAILPSNNLSNIYKAVSRPNSHISLPTHICFCIGALPTSFSFACSLPLPAVRKLFLSTVRWQWFKKRI